MPPKHPTAAKIPVSKLNKPQAALNERVVRRFPVRFHQLFKSGIPVPGIIENPRQANTRDRPAFQMRFRLHPFMVKEDHLISRPFLLMGERNIDLHVGQTSRRPLRNRYAIGKLPEAMKGVLR